MNGTLRMVGPLALVSRSQQLQCLLLCRPSSPSHICIDTEDRIALIVEHGKDMGDDEIRFHLATLLKQRGDRILVGSRSFTHCPGL